MIFKQKKKINLLFFIYSLFIFFLNSLHDYSLFCNKNILLSVNLWAVCVLVKINSIVRSYGCDIFV